MGKNHYLRIGPSEFCPFIPGESPQARHQRRLKLALDHLDDTRRYCEEFSIGFEIIDLRQGKRFIFRKSNRRIDWFPFTGEMTFDEQHYERLNVHDWNQLKFVLYEYMVKKVKGNAKKWFMIKQANINSMKRNNPPRKQEP